MGRGNRNKNKKEKQSDGSTGNVDSASNRSTNNNNDLLAPKEREIFVIKFGLKGYPKSNFFLGVGPKESKTR